MGIGPLWIGLSAGWLRPPDPKVKIKVNDSKYPKTGVLGISKLACVKWPAINGLIKLTRCTISVQRSSINDC